jgi:hypothetical protein
MSSKGRKFFVQRGMLAYLRITGLLAMSALAGLAAVIFAESATANATSKPVVFVKPSTSWQSGTWQSPGTIKVGGFTKWDQTPSKAPASFSYQWQSSNDGLTWVAIEGATSDSFAVPNGYQGKTFRALVTATNAAGSTTITSAVETYAVSGGTDLVSRIGDVTTNLNPTTPLLYGNDLQFI